MRRSISLVAVLCAAMLGMTVAPSPAQAFSKAFFPTQNAGNRGVDVVAIQYLVNVPTTGVFDAATTTAVRSFQSSKGLTVDGIVGPATWGALTPQIASGATGNAVRALQTQLNAKRRLSLAVSGTFDAATRSAVVAFQQHAGIGADGIVGPTTWKNLIWHYDYPAFDAMCDKDPDSNGTANWGTGAAIGQLETAVRSFASTGQGKVPLGDVGFEHGGDIPGHGSHEVGLDVDLWPIRTDSAQCTAGRITWRDSTYDRAATRELVKAIRAAAPGHVKVIWFNDPQLINEGLTSQLVNHDNHLHVRYCERVHPNASYDC